MADLVKGLFVVLFFEILIYFIMFCYDFCYSKNLSIFGTEWERKVKEVTSNTNEIADSNIMNQIAEATNHYSSYGEIMTAVWDRLDQKPKDWRIIYKV